MFIDKAWLEEQLKMSSEEARPFMQNFIEFETKRWQICEEKAPGNPERYFVPVMREEKITNLGLEIIGIIDRVDLNFDEKSFTVIDYKTEKFDTRSWKLSEHRREMAFYKVLLETSGKLKGPVTSFCIYYPRSNDVWVEPFNNRTLSALEKNLKKVREEIARGEFKCNVTFFCRYCNCNRICDMV